MTLPEEKIVTLLDGCRKGIRDSQRQLYGYLYGYAMSICMRYTKNNDEAVEVVNDGFLKIFNSIKKFEPKNENLTASLKSWAKKIFIYTAIDHFRATEKHKNHSEIDDHIEFLQEKTESIIDMLSYEDLIKLIQKLSPAYQTVFNLYVIDGFSHKEIADQLGITEGTSKSNLSKARVNLQEMLKKTNQEVYERYIK